MQHRRSGSPTTSARLWKRIGVAGAVAAIGFAPLVAGTAFAATSNVGDADLVANQCGAASPTGFCKYTRDGGTATVVNDARANSGTGYLRLDTQGGNDKGYVFAQQFAGKKLSEISDLAYETYVEKVGTNNAQQAPAVNIAINPNKAGKTFSTLVWEPLYTGKAVVPSTWQQWSPSSTPSGSGGWWASGTTQVTGQPNEFGFNTYTASFADVKAALPDAIVYGIGPNQGGGNPGLTAGVDLFKVNDDTYDFDNSVRPTGIVATGGDKQKAEANKPFPQPLSATVTGKNNAPVPGQDVTFTVTKGSASFGGSPTAKAPTGQDGVAKSPTLTAGPTTGPVEVTATSGTLTTTFTETVVPREADVSVAVTAPPTAVAGATIPVTVTVRNAGPVAASQVATGFNVAAGLKITKAPGGIISRDGRSVAYLTPTIAPDASAAFQMTVTVDRSVRGVQALNAGTATLLVKDPNLRNNVAQARVNVTK